MPQAALAPIHLLDADPDLGRLLPPDRLAEARRTLVARRHAVPAGPWADRRLEQAATDHLGLLVLDGLVAHEVVMADTVSTHLLGPGDIVRPWRAADPGQLLLAERRWTVLASRRAGRPRRPLRRGGLPLPGGQRRGRRAARGADAADGGGAGHRPAHRRRPAAARALLASRRAVGPRRARRHRAPAAALPRRPGRPRRRAPPHGLHRARQAHRTRRGGPVAGRLLAAARRAGGRADRAGGAGDPPSPPAHRAAHGRPPVDGRPRRGSRACRPPRPERACVRGRSGGAAMGGATSAGA